MTKPNAGVFGIRRQRIPHIEHRRTPFLDAIFSGLLKPGQQLRLLGGEFLFAEDSFITQFGKLLDSREDVRLTDRRSIDGLWRR